MAQSKQVAEELYECYAKTAGNIVLYFHDENKALEDLKDVVRTNCQLDTKFSIIKEIKEDILNRYDNSGTTEKSIQKIIQDYEDSVCNINADASKNERLLKFDRQVEVLLSDLKRNEVATESNNDEETQLSGSINVIDPISKTRIREPIKNIVCGHTYDRENIMTLLKVNRNTRCPMIGCKSKEYVEIANLQTDVVMKAYLQRNPV